MRGQLIRDRRGRRPERLGDNLASVQAAPWVLRAIADIRISPVALQLEHSEEHKLDSR